METNYSLANLGKRKKKTSAESRPVMITILSESRAERPLLESGWRRRHGAVRGGHRTWQGGRRTQWTKAGKWVMAGQWADKDRKEVGLSKRYERDSGGDTRPRTCSTYNYNSRAGISLWVEWWGELSEHTVEASSWLRASSPGVCCTKRHRFEPRCQCLYKIHTVSTVYFVPNLSIQSHLLYIRPPHRLLADENEKNKN